MDIGETSYAMALADDLDGDGRTDLVVATMNGVVYCFEAAASRFHPLHAWPAQVPWAPKRFGLGPNYLTEAGYCSRSVNCISDKRLSIP